MQAPLESRARVKQTTGWQRALVGIAVAIIAASAVLVVCVYRVQLGARDGGLAFPMLILLPSVPVIIALVRRARGGSRSGVPAPRTVKAAVTAFALVTFVAQIPGVVGAVTNWAGGGDLSTPSTSFGSALVQVLEAPPWLVIGGLAGIFYEVASLVINRLELAVLGALQLLPATVALVTILLLVSALGGACSAGC
jgi:hypothetical protein